MSLHEFIFSKKNSVKYSRHIVFWLIIYLSKFHLPTSQEYNIASLGIDIIYCYAIIYWIAPAFLFKKKYLSFISAVIAITILSFITGWLMYLWLYGYISQGWDTVLYETWLYTTAFIHIGPVMKCGIFASFKMLKNYYLKIKEKEILILETQQAELQLLKAQVQPHFLFNTLNNIYSFALNKSPQAAGLISKLNDTINYMNHECQTEFVPLKQELKMLQNYIGLEKVRYGQRLNLTVDIKGDFENKFISPLLLIPFVENSFKHGASKMLEHPWIELQIYVYEHSLDFIISNSKPNNMHKPERLNGIGLTNVRKRLELLYPRDHILNVTIEDHSFHVKLKLPLQIPKSELELTGTSEPLLAESYAPK